MGAQQQQHFSSTRSSSAASTPAQYDSDDGAATPRTPGGTAAPRLRRSRSALWLQRAAAKAQEQRAHLERQLAEEIVLRRDAIGGVSGQPYGGHGGWQR